ncbi:hypothetical protein CDAR_501181 [Caerostris darwini]|uniref:Uncharacterized protein n=1 Tax=Caerostris darwini TaxID=1538125 RepID=A0AAV4NQ26_9ARAC|nr:hypothetical protein CDAR_501181 [Caerostris darwini]
MRSMKGDYRSSQKESLPIFCLRGSCPLGIALQGKGRGNRVIARPPLSPERDYRPALLDNDALYQSQNTINDNPPHTDNSSAGQPIRAIPFIPSSNKSVSEALPRDV